MGGRERPISPPPGADLVVRLVLDRAGEELAADRLWTAGATAVVIGEAPDGRVELTASYPTAAAAKTVAGEVGGEVVAVDRSWQDAWRRHARPLPIGESLVVVPGWREVPFAPGRTAMRIDPRGVFGSGSHPSTRMVLAALEATPPTGLAVLDVGCGSGILMVAAALLGATPVTGVDVDPEAVSVALANVEANGVAQVCTASTTPVGELAGRWDLALVNVTAGVHAEIGSAAQARVGPGGRLIVAGLLPGQWRHVRGAYRSCRVVQEMELDGWEGRELVRDG